MSEHRPGPVRSQEIDDYFKDILRMNNECYEIASKARAQGYDPETFIEIPQADDLASRVEKLLIDYHVEGAADIIREKTKEYGNRELVSLVVAKVMA